VAPFVGDTGSEVVIMDCEGGSGEKKVPDVIWGRW
jgi:hypothetical protein